MNNYEKYRTEIDAMWKEGLTLALVGGKPTVCENTKCSECDMYLGYCVIPMCLWLVAEYEEPPIDWSKVKVDTPILVRYEEETKWRKRYFAKYENGKVYTWLYGRTSWSAVSQDDILHCDYAKLAESEG